MGKNKFKVGDLVCHRSNPHLRLVIVDDDYSDSDIDAVECSWITGDGILYEEWIHITCLRLWKLIPDRSED